MQNLESWINRDQLDVTCFIISLFNAQHVSDVNTSILRSLRLICGFISWVVLLWFDVCWCYGVVRLGWCGILMQASACIRMDVLTSEKRWALNNEIKKTSDVKFVSLYSPLNLFFSTTVSRTFLILRRIHRAIIMNPLTPNDHNSWRTAPLNSQRCILYIYSTNISTEYFKHDIDFPFFFSLQNAVCFIILTYLFPVLFTFYIQGVLKLNK